ncbi:hypothetical protein DFH11DRAFT_1551987 [Phellopilus nigrolimitatus]|nr:hypothetical protein DFH11DRAFT_1551987 [Phellopilus nigrolimitatus]
METIAFDSHGTELKAKLAAAFGNWNYENNQGCCIVDACAQTTDMKDARAQQAECLNPYVLKMVKNKPEGSRETFGAEGTRSTRPPRSGTTAGATGSAQPGPPGKRKERNLLFQTALDSARTLVQTTEQLKALGVNEDELATTLSNLSISARSTHAVARTPSPPDTTPDADDDETHKGMIEVPMETVKAAASRVRSSVSQSRTNRARSEDPLQGDHVPASNRVKPPHRKADPAPAAASTGPAPAAASAVSSNVAPAVTPAPAQIVESRRPIPGDIIGPSKKYFPHLPDPPPLRLQSPSNQGHICYLVTKGSKVGVLPTWNDTNNTTIRIPTSSFRGFADYELACDAFDEAMEKDSVRVFPRVR